MCFAPQRRALFRHLSLQKWSEPLVFLTFWLPNVLRATTACTFSRSELPKVVRPWCVLDTLTWKCASRHNGVPFFDIATSKSGPTLKCFVHFDLEMCFAPQRRALFRHRNFQKWSDAEMFCTLWLPNVLRATTACTFSTSEPPKVVRTPSVFNILTSKCASRHNGVHFFEIWTSKSGPTMVCFGHFDLEMCFAPQRRALFRHRNFQKWSDAEVFCTFWLGNVLRATTACTFRHLNCQKWSDAEMFCTFWLGNVLRATTACTFSRSELPKVVRPWCALDILTWKCASRHNGVPFFDIATSKSGPTLKCFVHFDLEMCFAPQRRALFRHLNCQKWSDAEMFCTLWLGNVLRATTACTFSTSQLPKVVRTWCVLYISTWKCASRHNGVQFFISHLASRLRTRRFSEPTFRPSGAPNHWKNTVFRDFPTFSRICIFFLLTLLSSNLSPNLSLLSASSLLCFSSVHIVGSLTSKLPSNMLLIWAMHRNSISNKHKNPTLRRSRRWLLLLSHQFQRAHQFRRGASLKRWAPHHSEDSGLPLWNDGQLATPVPQLPESHCDQTTSHDSQALYLFNFVYMYWCYMVFISSLHRMSWLRCSVSM